MPKKKQSLVNEKPHNKPVALSPERIEELFGMAAEAEGQHGTAKKDPKQEHRDRAAKARAVMQANRAARIKANKIADPVIAEPVISAPIAKTSSKRVPFQSLLDFVIGKKKAKPQQEQKETVIPTPILGDAKGGSGLTGDARALEVTDVPGDGHKGKALAIIAVSNSQFKYEGWQPQEIPASYRHMTPHWLWRRIHWEEQAKIARVKPSGLSPGLKIGAAIVVIVLGILVIFLFGIVLMDQGGG